ncbi:serine/threonine protein kinase [Saxophila tyrrhenica]|uniref:Serine/threonine protein kinase n=1 Tax=Saxophila tyrrhenica TaxID=1690608 RepID=A0AAV9PQB6_9PEZI|nr:serine/threonine protein kinase [Saxophila tyrrhenica]
MMVDRNLAIKLTDFGFATQLDRNETWTSGVFAAINYVALEILDYSAARWYGLAVDIWSAGIVLHICLCGFPPFSDELLSPENPYALVEQIKLGRFDYPSPYWDAVGDAALDLIDRMMTVDVTQRVTIEQCRLHPWMSPGYSPLSTSFPCYGCGRNVEDKPPHRCLLCDDSELCQECLKASDAVWTHHHLRSDFYLADQAAEKRRLRKID